MEDKKQKPLFVKLEVGAEAFRTWAVNAYLIVNDGLTVVKLEEGLVYGSWTNATYDDEMERMEVAEEVISKILPIAEWKPCRGNGVYTWVNGIAFSEVGQFDEWTKAFAKKLRKELDAVISDRVKNEINQNA